MTVFVNRKHWRRLVTAACRVRKLALGNRQSDCASDRQRHLEALVVREIQGMSWVRHGGCVAGVATTTLLSSCGSCRKNKALTCAVNICS